MLTPSVLSHADLAHLQGEWITHEGRRPGELVISGHKYILRFLDGTVYKGTFELVAPNGCPPETGHTPRTMSMHIEEGPPKHKGKSAWCLYSLEVGQLHWCPMEPGTSARLSDFPSLEDGRYLYTVFRRDVYDPD